MATNYYSKRAYCSNFSIAQRPTGSNYDSTQYTSCFELYKAPSYNFCVPGTSVLLKFEILKAISETFCTA